MGQLCRFFLGAAVFFPLGLILSVIAGGELLTGNMMLVSLSTLAGKTSFVQLLRNWFWVTLSNFVGAVFFVAYFFGHVVGLTGQGPFFWQKRCPLLTRNCMKHLSKVSSRP